jgi:hypothetical protein
MMKQIPQEIIELIRQLLVFDNYTKASARSGDFGTRPDLNNEVFLERFINSFISDFFNSSPFDDTAPPNLRSGETPLEVHMESGSGRSFLNAPGIVKAATGTEKFEFFIPEERSRIWFMFHFIIVTSLSDVNLRPADSIGNIDLEWHEDTQSLMLTVDFETSGTEIVGDISADFDDIKVRLFLKPRISRGRMLWDWGTSARVSVFDSDIVRFASAATNENLRQDSVRSFPDPPVLGGGDLDFFDFPLFHLLDNDASAASGLASGLVGFMKSIAASYAELIGNVFMALPLRPQPHPAQTLDDFLADLFSFAGISITPEEIGDREKFLLGVLSGYFTNPADIPLDSALGMQSVIKIFPYVDPLQLNETITSLSNNLTDAWRDELGRELLPEEQSHLDNVMVPRELESFLLNHIEYAHIVDRLATYTGHSVSVDDGTSNCIIDFDPLVHVPCMRYMISLDYIELVSEDMEGFSTNLRSILDGTPDGLQYFMIEWEVYSFHNNFGDGLDESTWLRDGASLLPGAQLLQRDAKIVPLTGVRMGLDGLFSKDLYLEWSTAGEGDAPNAKLLIVGRILPSSSFLNSEEFRIIIPMTPAVGLYTSESSPVSLGEVDNIVTFQAEEVAGMVLNYHINYRIVARLVQKPFAQHYEWINVEIRDMLISSTQLGTRVPIGSSVQLEARLNGVTYQTSPLYVVRGGPQVFNLGSGWSQDIVYDRTSVAEYFEIELVLHRLNPSSFESIDEIVIRKQIFRFSTEEQDMIRAQDSPLERAIEHARRDGAALEWGIPIGLPSANFDLVDDEDNPTLTIKVRISKKNLTRTPPEFSTKEYLVEFEKAILTDATWGSGADDVVFFPNVDVLTSVGETDYSEEFPVDRTREFELDEGEEVVFPGSPNTHIEGYPGRSRMTISCFGREYDWPPIDPNDSLGTAEVSLDIPLDSSIDRIYQDESHGSDGSFEMFVDVTTTSKPPQARLTFEGKPEGVDFLLSTSGAQVRLEYAAGWADNIILMYREETESGFSERDRSTSLVGFFTVEPATTTYYKIRSISASEFEDSREVQISIP